MKHSLILFIAGITVLALFFVAVYMDKKATDRLRQKAPFPDHVEIKVVTDRWTGVQYYLDGRGGLTKRAERP